VGVGEHDLPNLPRCATQAAERIKDTVAIRVEQRVDQGEVVPVVQQEGMDVATHRLTEAMDAWGYLHRILPFPCSGRSR
jgi:hypothetical protein